MTAPVSAGAVLHVGCGGDVLPSWLAGEETRLDIDERWKPDILASMTDLGEIGPFDTIYSSHSLEHLHADDAARALSEFHRVLKAEGTVFVIVPDLEDVKATDEVLYTSPAGPISGLDMIYGLRSLVAEMPAMAHRTGFTQASLAKAIRAAGFSRVRVDRLSKYNLFGVGVK
jgi:predicted SAM-dependent methyltransferase